MLLSLLSLSLSLSHMYGSPSESLEFVSSSPVPLTMGDSSSPSSHSPSTTKHLLPIKAVETSKPISSFFTTRKSLILAFGFTLVFVVCTFFFVFNPSSGYSFNNFIRKTNTNSYRSHFSNIFVHFLSNSSSHSQHPNSYLHAYRGSPSNGNSGDDKSHVVASPQDSSGTFRTSSTFPPPGKDEFTWKADGLEASYKNPLVSDGASDNLANRKTDSSQSLPEDTTRTSTKGNGRQTGVAQKKRVRSFNAASAKPKMRNRKVKKDKWLKKMIQCNLFDGKWVRDDSYPLYAPGSCSYIDEPFNCFLNGRRDSGYQKYRWQPNHCNIPRMNGTHMLELLRGKRLAFVGDSLNRNMWESMLCILQNSLEDKNRVFEASGRQEFRTEDSYSFVFQDYNFSVEFFRTAFLVQEWEMPDTNGYKKETLRLDLVDRSSDRYKAADMLIFNTGHWWTHEKTSSGKGYYQEGSHIHDHLDMNHAFHKALTTWARWVDANVDPFNTLVIFRGYSVSHFRGGEWNSGGKCDHETEPLKEDTNFEEDPPMVEVLERVLKGMKTPVFYLNVTRMTNFRKDAHPSIYREQNLTEEEKRSPLRFQDCSHWCLPGVPDIWNEIVYSQVLLKHKKQMKRKQNRQAQRKRQ